MSTQVPVFLAFVVVAAAAATLAAPIASAAPRCENTGPTTTLCQSNGSAQITTSPPVVNNWNGWPWWWGNSTGITISIGDIF